MSLQVHDLTEFFFMLSFKCFLLRAHSHIINKHISPLFQVVIPSGKRVLLNERNVTVAALTIEVEASVIWANIDNIVLSTHFILVKGELHIGSKTCRFDKRAHIRLLGKLLN